MFFNLACDLLGDELVQEFTGCRRIVRTEQGSAWEGTIYVCGDGSRWIHRGPMCNEMPGRRTAYLHGDNVCDHP